MSSHNQADYTVRVRFQIPSADTIDFEHPEETLTQLAGKPIALKSAQNEQPIKKAEWLSLWCSGWESEEQAEAATYLLMDALRRACARSDLGADLGRRAPQGGFTRAGLEMVQKETGRPTLNDSHGPMTFQTHPKPLFAQMGPVRATVYKNPEKWRKAFHIAIKNELYMNERERTAFDLFTSAHSIEWSADARFALLFASIEALLEDQFESESVVNHISELQDNTRESHLSKIEQQSIIGKLEWMKSHSIRKNGRNFVANALGDQRYGNSNLSSQQLFLKCYDVRNRLFHGTQPFPSSQEVRSLEGLLRRMVGDLLAAPLLNCETS